MEIHNFAASLFYFRASEADKIGPYAHTFCNCLNLTEIFYIGKIIQFRK